MIELKEIVEGEARIDLKIINLDGAESNFPGIKKMEAGDPDGPNTFNFFTDAVVVIDKKNVKYHFPLTGIRLIRETTKKVDKKED